MRAVFFVTHTMTILCGIHWFESIRNLASKLGVNVNQSVICSLGYDDANLSIVQPLCQYWLQFEGLQSCWKKLNMHVRVKHFNFNFFQIYSKNLVQVSKWHWRTLNALICRRNHQLCLDNHYSIPPLPRTRWSASIKFYFEALQ